jgi:hypothetical protein
VVHAVSGSRLRGRGPTRRTSARGGPGPRAQLQSILADGIAAGAFRDADPAAAAQAVFNATARFHHPAHAREWQDPGTDTELDAVCTLILNGLASPTGA